MLPRPPDAQVLLDFDRTLNDSDLVYERNLDGLLGLTGRQVFQHWQRIHRYIVSNEPFERHEDLELHFRMLLEELARVTAVSVKAELRRRIRAAQEECWYATALFPEAIPFLNRMKDAGYTLHIATGDYAKTKAEHIERQGGCVYFAATFDEETLGVGKGKRDYFDRLLDRLMAQARNVVMVGDSLKNDIGPGQQVGLSTVWVRRKNEAIEQGVQPDITVASLTEVLVAMGVG
ncbi:MAG: HAD family hydrolase [Chloroflexi bacterium]|nr:HAD family hydrolase [Chloroflexota bacterium]